MATVTNDKSDREENMYGALKMPDDPRLADLMSKAYDKFALDITSIQLLYAAPGSAKRLFQAIYSLKRCE